MTWEDKFTAWSKPPSQSEMQRCDNAETEVRAAIEASPALRARNIRVFLQGSYRNNTNVKQDSDVDVGILCFDTYFYDLPSEATTQSLGITPATYGYAQFKNDVGSALEAHFGKAAIKRGNKTFNVKETSTQIDADVTPFFEHRRYENSGHYLSGCELRPDNGEPSKVINWPEQHYTNGVSKNNDTGRRYKAVVRIVKSLRNEMDEGRIIAARPIIGFLNECLVWNVPNSSIGNSTYYEDVRQVLIFLYNATKEEQSCTKWGEVSELKYLFRGPQKWTREQANAFLLAAWQYVGFN